MCIRDRIRSGLIIVKRHVEDLRVSSISARIHTGELTCIHLFYNTNANFIVSDDREFLREMRRLGIPVLTSPSIIVLMVSRGFLDKKEGLKYLLSLRGMVSEEELKRAYGRLLIL